MPFRRRRERVEERRRLFRGGSHHPFDEVDAAHLFGDAMLDLEPRVHFEEVEIRRVGVDDELHGARRPVVHGLHETNRGARELVGAAAIEVRRGRLFDDLLVSSLRRAVALADADDASVAVAEDLDLDVTRPRDVFFEKGTGVLEVARTEPSHRFEGAIERLFVGAETKPDAAAARGALQHHRVADARRGELCFRDVGEDPGTGQERDVRRLGDLARRVLQAEFPDLIRRGTDERNAVRFDGLGELGVFAQEAVPRMDRLRARVERGAEDLRGIQIALTRRRGPDADRFVGRRHVERAAVGFGVDGDGSDAHAPEGTDHAASDLAAIGNEDLAEHARKRIKNPKSGSTPRAGSASGCRRCTDCSAAGSSR